MNLKLITLILSATISLSSCSTQTAVPIVIILNTNTKKFHYPPCTSVNDAKEKNKREFTGTRDEAITQGYVPCQRCNP